MKSGTAIKQSVRFKGDFKKEKVKGELPGRDVAEFIAGRLREKNFPVQSVENEEIWFTVNVVSGSIEYPLMVCQSSINADYWEISCPQTLGFFARLFGKSEDAEMQNLTDALDGILQGEKTITDIKWYSDYAELSDDYAQKRGEKRLSVVGKYLQKLFLPLCLSGMVLIIIGAIRNGEGGFLLRLGGIIFSLPFIAFLGLFAINILWALIDDIKESFLKRTKKKWVRWLFALFFVSMIVVPFFLGLMKNQAVERAMPTIQKYMFRLMILVFFGVMALIFGSLFVRSFSRIFIPRYRKNKIRKESFVLIGSFLALAGFTGFFGGAASLLGMLGWIGQSIEFPLADVDDLEQSGNVGLIEAACRFDIQRAQKQGLRLNT